jgi:hypothetical protein
MINSSVSIKSRQGEVVVNGVTGPDEILLVTCDYDNDKRAVADLSVEQATALIEALQQIIA